MITSVSEVTHVNRKVVTLMRQSVIPRHPIRVAHARDVTVGMWIVPKGRVEAVYHSGVSQVRTFMTRHPRSRKMSMTRTLTDDTPVLVRGPTATSVADPMSLIPTPRVRGS